MSFSRRLRAVARELVFLIDRSVERLVALLHRPGRAWLITVLGSPIVTLENRERCRVAPLEAGLLAHCYRDGITVYPALHGSSPAQMRRDALDTFCWEYVPKPGDCVVDIGAGIGEESVTFADLVGPEGRVVSVEAHPETFRRLALTCELNRLHNVVPVHCAISDRPGAVRIGQGYFKTHVGSTLVESGGSSVPAKTVDQLVEEFDLGHIDLLKMNIEGAERLAIHAMSETLRRTRHVVVSCHDFLVPIFGADPEEVATFDRIRDYLDGAGFEVATRPDDRRPWIRYYVYACKAPTTVT